MSVIFPQVPNRLRRALGRFVGPAGAALFSLVLASCAGGGFGGAGDASGISGVNPVSQPAPVASGPISPASQRKVAEAVSGLDLGEETPPISPEDIAVSNDSGILDSNPFSSSAPAARSSGWGARADSTRKTQGYKAFEVAVPSENPLMTVAVWISETPPDYPEGKPEQDPEADRKFLYLRLRVFIEVGNAALVEGGGVEVLDSEVIVVEEKRPDPKPIVPEEPESQPDPNAPVLVAVNFSLSGSGTVLAEGESGALVAGGEVRQGSTVIFTATPNRGYQVSAWLGDCAGTAAAATSCAVAATRDVSAGAIFTDINECATNTHVCAAEGGLCANTDGGFTCSCAIGYSGDGVTCNGDKAVPDPNAPVLAAVNFSSSGSGTVSAEGESGALVAGGEIRQGSTVIFTATPGAGYYVSGWSGNCADAGEVADGLDGTAKSCAAAADSDLSVRAEFSEIPSLAGPLCPSGSLPTNGLTRAELNMTLRLAARGGDAARVCEALRRGAEVNDNLGDSEFTALQEAVDGGYLNVSELLLANGAEVNKRKGGSGRSPLDLAARDEEAEIAALLRNAGGRCFLETGPLCGDIPAATPDPATVAATVAGYSCPAGSLPRGDHTQEQLDDNLHAAGWDLSAEKVCEWLRRGANVNAKRDHKTLLHGAAWGAYEIAALLLAHGADVNAKDLWKETPLYAAAIRDNREMAALLLAHGADVNAKNYGNTPLYEAAHHNSEEVAALLIENGADVNAEVDMSGRGTPLHAAARRNSEEVAALLLANGADVNARAQWDGTPLHQAAYHNSRGIVALLLANGADVNAETISVGRSNLGGTALDIARRRRNSAVVALLEAAKIPSIVSTVAVTVAGYSCPAGSLPRGDHTQEQLDDNLHAAGWDLSAERVCEWLRRGANVNAKRDHKTLLHVAAWGAYEIAALLLAHGADVNAKNLWKDPPLYAAATRDNREMAALLIANGADVSADEWLRRGANVNAKRDHKTLLHVAAWGAYEIAALLLAHGADVNAKNLWKDPPLYAAATRDNREMAALLIANGADVNAKNYGNTPLHEAAFYNSEEVAALLIENGADVNAEVDMSGRGTPLHVAARQNSEEVAALLLANGADVNARAQWDGMPLHEAARHNSEEVVALLLANGADVNADSVGRNNLGGTALDIARRRRNSAVVALLEAAENLPVAAEADALAKELRESFAGAFNPSPAFGDAFGAVSGASEKILTRLDSLMRSTAGSGGDAWDSFSGWQRENDVGRMWFSTNQRGDFGFGAGDAGAGGDLSVSPFAALAGNGMLAGGETGFGESGKLRIAAFGDYQARSLLDGSDREWTQWAARGTAIEKAMTEAERFSGLSENRTRGAMTEIHLGGGDLGVALQAGAVSESDSVLSGTAGNDDLRGLRSRTAFAGLSGAADLFGSGWRLRGSAHLGRSWTESEGLLRDGDLWASAFSAGLERGGWLYSDDGFVLRFSQPLRVESWEMRLAGEQGGRWLGAGPSGRQLDVDAAYRLPLSGGGWLLLSAGVRRDGGHSSSSDLEAGALFSVERGF